MTRSIKDRSFKSAAWSVFSASCTVIFSALFLVAVVLPARAQEYRPFTVKLGVPAELLSEYTGLKSEPYPDQASTAAESIVPINLNRYTVHFDQRIASMMEHIFATHGVQFFPDYTDCLFDSYIGQFNAPKQAKVAYALERANNLCLKLHQPEVFFNAGSVFNAGLLNMTGINDLIETAVTPSLLQNVPFSLFDEVTTQSIRSALLRVKFTTVENDFADLVKRIKAMANADEVSGQDREIATLMLKASQKKLEELRKWNEEGKNQFRIDTRRVTAAGKTRGSMEFKNMPDVERKNLTMYLYAMMWRFRGGGYVPLSGTQLARLYYAQLPYAILAGLNGLDQVTAFTVGAKMFYVLAAEGWGRWMDMGTTSGEEPELNDLIHMSIRGLHQTNGIEYSLASEGYNTEIMRFYTLHFGICYIYSFDKLKDVILKGNMSKPFSGFYDWPTAWGEHCAGASLGLGLAETLLNGQK